MRICETHSNPNKSTMILTRGTTIGADKPTPTSKLHNNDTLRALLSKTMSWHGASKREQVTRDQSPTTASIQEIEGSLDDTEDQESASLYEKMEYSHNYVSSSQSSSVLDETNGDPSEDQDENACNRRSQKIQDDPDGHEKTRRRSTMKRQESQRVPRRRNSITVMSSLTFATEPETDISRQELDAGSQHSSTNVARSDRRRTTRPRRNSLGYVVTAPTLSTEPSEFRDMLQKRLDRIDKLKVSSDYPFDRSQSNLFGYEGEEWHGSSSNIVSDSQGRRRCGRRARRHSIGSIAAVEDDSNRMTNKGATHVDADYGYEDPDGSKPSVDESAPARRQLRNMPRRARRLSVGQRLEKDLHDDGHDSVADKSRESLQVRERRRSMHF